MLQQLLAKRSKSDDQCSSAREAWKAWENVGRSCSLIILGCKRQLALGSLVESVNDERITIKNKLLASLSQRFHNQRKLSKIAEPVLFLKTHVSTSLGFVFAASQQCKVKLSALLGICCNS